MPLSTLRLLTRQDVRALLPIDDCIAAVERAFELAGRDAAGPQGMLAVHSPPGGFHVKAAVLARPRTYFAAKINGNFPGNPAAFALPTIQGVIVLADAEHGTPLAIMDSAEITALRTAAATAVAARRLARASSRTVTIVGCGTQGRAQLRALSRVLSLTTAQAVDLDQAAALRFAREMSVELGFDVRAADDLRAACRVSDVVVCCTTSRTPVLLEEHLHPGMFIAAVGADHPEKQEMAAAVMAASRIVADTLVQAVEIGDLHHAIGAGVVRAEAAVELGHVLTGQVAGRRHADEVVIFDSTGVAFEDVAAAAVTYEHALERGVGLMVSLRD